MGWGWMGGGGGLVAKVLTSRGGGVVPNLDPFGQTENGGGGAKIGHFSWMS